RRWIDRFDADDLDLCALLLARPETWRTRPLSRAALLSGHWHDRLVRDELRRYDYLHHRLEALRARGWISARLTDAYILIERPR
ncbi:MAG: hypothetical protein AAF772_21590, partial [Acidobacteriota bacterium]